MMVGRACVLVALLLGACAPVKLTQSFDPAEAAYAVKPGAGVIEGETFVRKLNGSIVTGAGLDVLLLPAVPVTREIMATLASGAEVADIPEEIDSYSRAVRADAKGRFRFEKVSAGEYYVFVNVSWTEGRGDSRTLHGKRIFEHVKLGPGERKSVTVSGAAYRS